MYANLLRTAGQDHLDPTAVNDFDPSIGKSPQEVAFDRHVRLGYSHYCDKRWLEAVKSFNVAITSGGRPSTGLSDTLILLTESYANLQEHSNALHSARLAVVTVHQQIADQRKSPPVYGTGWGGMNKTPPNSSSESSKIYFFLDGSVSLVAAYYNLGLALELTGDHQLSLEWYERVTRTALKVLKNVGNGTSSSSTETSGKVTAQLQLLLDTAEESRARLHREYKTELLVIKDVSNEGHQPLLYSSYPTPTHTIYLSPSHISTSSLIDTSNLYSLSHPHCDTNRNGNTGRHDRRHTDLTGGRRDTGTS